MIVLLQEAVKHGITPHYIRQLLTTTGSAEDRTPVKQVLIESLSERESGVSSGWSPLLALVQGLQDT